MFPSNRRLFTAFVYFFIGSIIVFDILWILESANAIKSEVLGKGDFLQALTTIITGTLVVYWLKTDDRKYDSEKSRINRNLDLLEAKFVSLMNYIEDNDPDDNDGAWDTVTFSAKISRKLVKISALIGFVEKSFPEDLVLKVQGMPFSVEGSFTRFCDSIDETKIIDGIENHYLSKGSDTASLIRLNIYEKHLEFILILNEIRKLSS
jgi:hypothetical protein